MKIEKTGAWEGTYVRLAGKLFRHENRHPRGQAKISCLLSHGRNRLGQPGKDCAVLDMPGRRKGVEGPQPPEPAARRVGCERAWRPVT